MKSLFQNTESISFQGATLNQILQRSSQYGGKWRPARQQPARRTKHRQSAAEARSVNQASDEWSFGSWTGSSSVWIAADQSRRTAELWRQELSHFRCRWRPLPWQPTYRWSLAQRIRAEGFEYDRLTEEARWWVIKLIINLQSVNLQTFINEPLDCQIIRTNPDT